VVNVDEFEVSDTISVTSIEDADDRYYLVLPPFILAGKPSCATLGLFQNSATDLDIQPKPKIMVFDVCPYPFIGPPPIGVKDKRIKPFKLAIKESCYVLLLHGT
jgi:hypothetical protein